VIDWTRPDWHRAVPKAALVDALRNSSIGPANLSRQDKADLVDLAQRHLRPDLDPARVAALRDQIEHETAFRRGGEA
jgi:hypothetical protein